MSGYAWEIELQPPPDLYRAIHVVCDYENITGVDTWLTPTSLNLTTDIPGIPPEYALLEEMGKALYVRGIPAEYSAEETKEFFTQYGCVIKCPILISLPTGCVFRWVIMGTRAEAEHAINCLQLSMISPTKLLYVSKSLKPGRTLSMSSKNILQDSWDWENTPPGNVWPTAHPVNYQHGGIPMNAMRLVPTPPAGTPHTSSPALIENARRISSPVGALSTVSVKRSETNASSESALTKIVSPPQEPTAPVAQASSSWAKIAKTTNPETRVFNLQPRNSEISKATRLRIGADSSRWRSGSNASGNSGTLYRPTESLADQERVVLLLNLPNNITLHDISEAIREGPVARIVFGHDEEEKTRYAGIIFLYASSAREFLMVLAQERKNNAPGRFRTIVESAMGEHFPADETIRRMGPPLFATRRLTLVKAGFFFLFGKKQLTELFEKLVTKEKIQIIWLYNGGNATAAFADVDSAIRVKNELDKRVQIAHAGGAESQIWDGLSVSFSKDFCAVPVELKTDMISD